MSEQFNQNDRFDEYRQEAAYNRFIDLFARMIQKYGPEITFPNATGQSDYRTDKGEMPQTSPPLFCDRIRHYMRWQ